MIRFKMDGQVTNELPLGWDDLTISVKVNRELVYVRDVQVDTRFTWYRDGYEYLQKIHRQSNGCAEVVLEIEEDPCNLGEWEGIYRGVIKMPAVIWSYEPDSAQTPVEDTSWNSYLNNNRDLKIDVTLTKTKNGLPITPPTPTSYLFQDPAGVQPNKYRDAYLIYDVLSYVVYWLSDGKVTLESKVLEPGTLTSAGGKYWNYVLQSGYRLRTGLVLYEPLTVTLSELLKNLAINFALGVQLQPTSSTTAILKLEPLVDLQDAAPVLTFNEVHPITVTTDASRLYGTVKVGSSETLEQGGALQFPENTRWRGFVEEQYYPLGQCNLNAELDLMRSYVVSSNVLESIIFQADSSYDDKVCLIERGTLFPVAAQYNWLTPQLPPLYFNEHLTNEYVTRRWLGGIPGTLVSDIGRILQGRCLVTQNTIQSDAGFNSTALAYNTWTGHTFNPIIFNQDTPAPYFNDGGWFNLLTDRWTSSISGLFRFELDLNMRLIINADSTLGGNFVEGHFYYRTKMGLWRKDATNVLKATYETGWTQIDSYNYFPFVTWPTPPPINLGPFHLEANIPLDATDYIQAFAVIEIYKITEGPTFGFRVDTQVINPTFACTQTSDFGDFSVVTDPTNNLSELVKFRAPITRPELRGYLSKLGGAVEVHTNGRTWKGWVESLKYDHSSNFADVTLITSKNLLPL